MLILAMENPVLHQMHGKQYLPYLFTSRFRIFSKSSFLKSHKYMNSFMRAHLTSCTAETKPIYASKKNFCLIKPLKYMCVLAWGTWHPFSHQQPAILCAEQQILWTMGLQFSMGCVCPFPDLDRETIIMFWPRLKIRKYPHKVWRHLAVLHLFKKGSLHVTFSQGVIKNDDEVE